MKFAYTGYDKSGKAVTGTTDSSSTTEASESLRCLAAHHIAELGLSGFRPRLEALRASERGFFVSRVLERALQQLASPGSVQRA